jgi:hypothetical protein
MTLRINLLICFILSSLFSFSQEFAPPSLERAEIYRNGILSVKQLEVYEGLPHQLHEKSLLTKELKRDDIVKFAGFPFYTPSVRTTQIAGLIAVLSDKSAFKVYGGLKRCGAYHPDYCVSWKNGNKTYYALICYGCGELVFYDGRKPLIYDMQEGTLAKLKELLKGYALKRPK